MEKFAALLSYTVVFTKKLCCRMCMHVSG